MTFRAMTATQFFPSQSTALRPRSGHSSWRLCAPTCPSCSDFYSPKSVFYRSPELREQLERDDNGLCICPVDDEDPWIIDTCTHPALEFVWTTSRCTVRFDPEQHAPYVVKDIEKVKKKGFSWNES